MKNRIITISREFGSGGRTIGREVASKLCIPCYDEELIEKIAEKSGFAQAYIKERGEYASSSSWIGNALAERDYSGHSVQDDLWNAQSAVIRELGETESCVIVGRCADSILRDAADLLTVFIHASIEKRAERIVSVYGEREDSPKKRLLDKDKRRRAYYQLYTDTEWGKVQNYQIALDSGMIGINRCVDIIAALYKR